MKDPWKVRHYGFILIIPALLMVFSALLRSAAGPLWQWCDPSYIYLFNALHMVKGIAPTYIGHPGTPLQLLILWVIWLSNLGIAAKDILNKVLTDPEFYLYLTYIVLLLLSFITSIFLASYIYHKTKSKTAVFLAQLPVLSFLVIPCFTSIHTVIPVVANVSPEPLLISVMNLFNLGFLMLFFARTPREEVMAVLFSGFTCGLGLATKLTFLPLLIPALIVISWRLKPLFMVIVSLAFVLWTLPIVPRYPLLWKWAMALMTHKGYDGTGDEGVVDWHLLLMHFFKDILGTFWYYLIPVGGAFIYSSIQFFRGSSGRAARFLWAAALGVLLQMIMVAKHFTFHYLVPGISLCGAVFFLFYIDKLAQNQLFRKLAAIFIFLFISFNIVQAMAYRDRLSSTTKDLMGFQDEVYLKYPNCSIIASTSNTVSFYLDQDYALFFGNNNGNYIESEDLFQLYPHHFYLNTEGFDSSVYGYGIWDAKKRVFADDILASSPCVILLSGSDLSQSPYETRLIETSKYANAYLLLNSTEKQASELFSLATDSLKRGYYPQAFALALRSRGLNFQPRGEVDYLLAGIYQHLRQK